MAGKSDSLPLFQEILIILALKGALLALIWFAWFSNPETATLNQDRMASQIYSPSSQKEAENDAVPRAR